MRSAGRWLRSFFVTGKKEKKNKQVETLPSPLEADASQSVPKEKKRWSFRRSTASGRSLNSPDQSVCGSNLGLSDAELDQKRHAMAVAVATAAAADAAVAAAQAAAAVFRLTAGRSQRTPSLIEGAAAIKIQSAFRGYLARKALCALRGLVKLQALVRGYLVRKQATATLHCMQALVTAQARVRAQRMQMVEEAHRSSSHQQPINRRSPQHPWRRRSYELDGTAEENIKVVELDRSEPRRSKNSYSTTHSESTDHRRFSAYYGTSPTPPRGEQYQQFSPAPSGVTEMSPRAYSGHFEDFSFMTAQSSPLPDAIQSPFDYPFFPNYMANTESSRAKARSQSAPKQRTDLYERQSSRRKTLAEGRNIPTGVKMQRSSSHIGMTSNGYQYPWPINLDRSSASHKDSECGSTTSALTNTCYCRSLVGIEVHRNRY